MPQALIAERTLSATDIQNAIDRLSIADGLRLLKIAGTLCFGTGIDADDLFQEAIRRALDGSRRCPRDVDPVVFLAGAIRSISDSERKKRACEYTVRQAMVGDMLVAKGATDAGIGMETEYKEMVDALFTILEGDEEAQLVSIADLDGLSATEIREQTGMDKTALATVRRRIRRKIRKAYPKGWTR